MIQTKTQREYIAARSAEEKMGYPCPENLGVAQKTKVTAAALRNLIFL